MDEATSVIVPPELVATRRAVVRRLAAAVTGVISLLYLLIGSRVVTVVEDSLGRQDGAAQTAFGLTAGIAFLLGVFLILRYDRRVLWMLGAAAQAFIIFTYFDLAAERTPSYEFWGILIRVPQTLLFALLVYLAIRPGPVAPMEDAA